MPQFRKLPSFESSSQPEMEIQRPEVLKAAHIEVPAAPSQFHTTHTTEPLPRQTDQLPPMTVIPGQLINISGQYRISTTGYLKDLTDLTGTLSLSSPSSPSTIRGMTVIPGSRKREQNTDELPVSTQRMSPRLRHGITLSTIFVVIVMTLLSLAPLDNGQSAFPLIGGVSDWFHAQQLDQQFQAQQMQSSNPTTSSQNNSNNPTPVSNANLPPMTIANSPYVAVAQQDATKYGISPIYFVRQINQESSFNPNAVSPAGAVGIAQFLPSTAAGMGVNPWNPISALDGAARMMANAAKQYGGDYAMALAAYNGGGGTVQYAVNACGSSWMNCLPGETRNYIHVIMGI